MSRAKPLSKNPTLLTALLSTAAIAGYVTYRLTASAAREPAETTPAMAAEHAHDALPPPLADSLPAVVLDDLAGTPTALASFAGKPLIVNFWATWCAPCLREIPLLKAFHEEHPGIDVVGIAVDRLEPVLDYADDMQFNYPILVGQSDGMDAMAEFRNDAGVMPFSVFTTAEGRVLAARPGELHTEHLEHFATILEQLQAGDIDLAAAREQMAPQ